MSLSFLKFEVADKNLTAGETTVFTLKFSEPVVGLSLNSFRTMGVTLSNLESSDGGQTWTAVVTPNQSYNSFAVINLGSGSYTSVSGETRGKSITFDVDTTTVVDNTAPDASTTQIVLDDITSDNSINTAESKQQIELTGKVQGEVQAGDVVTITINGQQVTTKVKADKTFSVDVSGADLATVTSITASVAASDAAGNVNNDGSINTTKSYSVDVDLTAPNASTTNIVVDDITADNLLNSAEVNGQVQVTGKVTGEFSPNDVVKVSVNGNTYTTKVDANGDYTVSVDGADLAAQSSISAVVFASDAKGNINTVGDINSTKTYTVDTTASGDFTITNFTDSGSALVAGSDSDRVSNDNNYTLSVTGLEVGSSVVYQEKVNGTWTNVSAQQTNVADGTHEYRAIITDVNNNVTTINADAITIDTQVTKPVDVNLNGNVLTGNVEGNSVVILQNKAGTTILTTTADATGAFTFNIPTSVNLDDLYVVSEDAAGNKSESVIASLPTNYIEVYTAASSLNADNGLVSYESLKTTSGHDIITIGDEHRQAWTAGTNGNIWNKNPAAGVTVIDTGAGNDSIEAGGKHGHGDMFAHTKVNMGIGNDTFSIKGKMLSNSKLDMGSGDDVINIGKAVKNTAAINAGEGNDQLKVGWDIDGSASVKMGEGNDTVYVGDDVEDYASISTGTGNDDVHVKENVEQHAKILLGEGNDTLTVGLDIDGRAVVDTGAGNDVVKVGDDIEDFVTLNTGSGDDSVRINDNIEQYAQLTLGAGSDQLTVGHDIDGRAKVDTGLGNDTIRVNEDIEDYARINMGEGNDTLSVGRYVENSAVINMGSGDNVAEMVGLNNSAKILFGSGNDKLTVTDQFGVGGGSAKAYMGDGDDVFTFGGKTLDGMVHGGFGKDTLVLNFDDNNSLTTSWDHITNLHTGNMTGFEVIDLQGNNAVDVYYSDLVQDTTREGALFIKGDSSSKVDLGGTDWNSDTDMNLRDYTGGHWQAIGSKTVEGVQYDVYHNSYANDHSNDVYIQTGIVVI